MKLKITLPLILSLGILLIGCGPSSKPTTPSSTTTNVSTSAVDPTTVPTVNPTVPPLSNEEKTLQILNNFDVLTTNGFDYSIKQTYKNSLTNSYNSEVRINNKESLVASKIENYKELNTDINGNLYKESTIVSYYKDNQIGTLVDSKWTWTDAKFDDFVDVRISKIDFSKVSLIDELLIEDTNCNTYSFKISDHENNSIMNVDNLTNVKFEIVVDSSYTNLISLKVTFDQKLTSSEINFKTYHGETNIMLPE